MKSPRKAAVVAVLTASVLAASGSAAVAAPAAYDTSSDEEAQLQELYEQAVAEGGDLVIYAGGDKPGQADYLRDAFEEKFPEINANVIVDFSKNHDARIDNQVAEGKVVADVAHLQTIDDFPRWKSEGVLEQYRPVGWDHVYDEVKDPDGYYTGVFFFAFSNVTATALGSDAPVEAEDFLKPEFKDKLVFTYPNDDDAVLYYFKQLTDEYGFDYLEKLLEQNPTFVRGTQDSADLVGTDEYVASFGTSGGTEGLAQQTYPEESPWVAWPQTAGILKEAPHPAAAKLYMSWLLSSDAQQNDIGTWSVRDDVAPPAGTSGIFDYPNMDPLGLGEFMSDRTALERYKARIRLYVGDVQGVNPSDPDDVLGLYPIDQQGTQGA
ncbi:ABC transporter substrate-binding protein [Glycomyces buryatensis]|uniref:Extracellular solute-binding protein n=1 Tax=Glycomyces buryatensis TaxID=2570927 RepID=A0A4S8QCZ6_9ACTN|nr:extracellular solute-binding protein [Glycomyces buryatensis]THV41471.1 extracellular solute-binding protein [Glycomyces buryatensis]